MRKVLLKEKDNSAKEPSEDIAILPKDKMPQFIAGRLSECTLLEIFGKLDVQSPIDIEIKILESFETDLSYINPLCPINDRIRKVPLQNCLFPSTTLSPVW
jgi:hypothetical protein